MDSPRRLLPSPRWRHYACWDLLRRRVLPQVPSYFSSTINISGIPVSEIHTFGTVLSAAIEEEIVRTLNRLKNEWNIAGNYEDYLFIRQPERFPDVLLRHVQREEVVLGIELKSWYLLSKEGEPSFRFTASPNACARADLIMVVLWALSNVLSGTPQIFEPYIEQALYVAQYRNYWWQVIRRTEGSTEITSPPVKPYPSAREQIADVPRSDTGRNFGRIARIGLMDAYIQRCLKTPLLGIPAQAWLQFFRSALHSLTR